MEESLKEREKLAGEKVQRERRIGGERGRREEERGRGKKGRRERKREEGEGEMFC